MSSEQPVQVPIERRLFGRIPNDTFERLLHELLERAKEPRFIHWIDEAHSCTSRCRKPPPSLGIPIRSRSIAAALVHLFTKLFGKGARLPSDLANYLLRFTRELCDAQVTLLFHSYWKAYRATCAIDSTRFPFSLQHSITFDANDRSEKPRHFGDFRRTDWSGNGRRIEGGFLRAQTGLPVAAVEWGVTEPPPLRHRPLQARTCEGADSGIRVHPRRTGRFRGNEFRGS